MRHTFSILALIGDLLRKWKDQPADAEYLGYESYPSAHLSTGNAPTTSGAETLEYHKAA